MNKQLKTQVIILSITYIVLIIAGIFFIKPNLDLEYFWFYNLLLFIFLIAYIFYNINSKNKRIRISDLENKIRELNKTNKHKLNSEDIALNYLPVGIVIYDESEEIVYANSQAKDYFSNVLVGRSLKRFTSKYNFLEE